NKKTPTPSSPPRMLPPPSPSPASYATCSQPPAPPASASFSNHARSSPPTAATSSPPPSHAHKAPETRSSHSKARLRPLHPPRGPDLNLERQHRQKQGRPDRQLHRPMPLVKLPPRQPARVKNPGHDRDHRDDNRVHHQCPAAEWQKPVHRPF